MSTKRKGVPPPRGAARDAFTLLDELQASPTEPMPTADAARRVSEARKNFRILVDAAEPHKVNWQVVTMVSNVLEVMRELDMIQDPEGLLHDSYLTMCAVSEHANEHGVPPRLVGAEITTVEGMINAFEHVLAAVPHRDVIRAMRELDKRLRVLKRTDYDANPAKRKKS